MRSERIEETTEANRRAAASALRGAGWIRTALVGRPTTRPLDARPELEAAAPSDVLAPLARLLALPETAPAARIVEQARQELLIEREARRALERELAELGRIAGAAAHDLNNVLTAIVGYADLLELESTSGSATGTSAATDRADLEEIRIASMRGARIVEEVLAVSRRANRRERGDVRGSEHGTAAADGACAAPAVDLGDRVVRMASLLRRIAGQGIAVELRLEPELPAVCIDVDRLERVLMNLVANARHAIEARPASRGRIEIAVMRVGSGPGACVRLSVVDDGCGMSRALQSRIFEPYFTTRADCGGTGLGLAAVAELVREAGGEIRVESEPDRGTAIHLDLPNATAPRPTRPAPRSPAPRAIGYPAPARGEERCASGSTTCSASVPGG